MKEFAFKIGPYDTEYGIMPKKSLFIAVVVYCLRSIMGLLSKACCNRESENVFLYLNKWHFINFG